MLWNDRILTMLANAVQKRKGYHVDIAFKFTQPGVPDFEVNGTLDVLFPGNLVFTTVTKEGLVTAATTDSMSYTRLNFPKAEAMRTPMPPSRSRISRCLAATAMFDDGLADILSGLVPYGGDISLVRDAGTSTINGIQCAGYIVDVGKRTPMPTSVTLYVGKSDQQLYRYVTDHPSINGAQRTVTLSSPKEISVLPVNTKITDKGMQKMTPEPEFGGGVLVGKMAPPLAGNTLAGKPFDLDSPTKANARIVHFWSALDQASCLQVVDISNAVAGFPKGSVQIISVCLDHVPAPQRVKALWSRLGAPWQTIVDPLGPDSDAARTWRTDTPGGIVILSRSGVVQSMGLRSTDITAAVTAAMRLR
jgi:hypothetical protein